MDIGTPAQRFSFVVDTRFPDVTVVDSKCVNCVCPASFDRRSSSTFTQTSESQIDGASGLLGKDKVALAEDPSATVPKQTLFAVQRDPGSRLKGRSGIFPLAYQNTSSTRQPFVYSLKERGLISEAVIALYFGKYSELASSISFGGWDLATYSTRSIFNYIDLYSYSGLWEFDISSVAFGPFEFPSLQQSAVIDSTARNFTVPKEVYEGVKDAICHRVTCSNSSSGFTFECDDEPEGGLFNFTFVLGGQEMSIPSEFYLRREYRKKRSTLCYLAMNWQGDSEQWVLGLPFLQRYYLLFDYENARLGFAPAKQDDSLPAWFLWLLVGAAAVIIGVIGLICCLECGCYCRQVSELTESLLGRF